MLKWRVVNNSFVLSLAVLEKMTNFALELRAEVKKMSVYSFGIPFLITCSGEAARQFYNPLQDRSVSYRDAALDGRVPTNVALNFTLESNFYSLIII